MDLESGQGSSGQGRVSQHEGVCFNMSTWKILKGNIMNSAADVSLCLHAWNWGWSLWSKWKRTAEVCRAAESTLCLESKSESHLRIFPGSPGEFTFWDQRHGNTIALIHLSLLARPVTVWHGQWKHSESLPAVADHQSRHASSHRANFYNNSSLSSASSFTTFRMSFWIPNRWPAKQEQR